MTASDTIELPTFISLADMQEFVATHAELIDKYLELSEIYWSLNANKSRDWDRTSSEYADVSGKIFELIYLNALENDGWDFHLLANCPKVVNQRITFVDGTGEIFETEVDSIGQKNDRQIVFEAKRNPRTELRPNQKRLATVISNGGELYLGDESLSPTAYMKVTTYNYCDSLTLEVPTPSALMLRTNGTRNTSAS